MMKSLKKMYLIAFIIASLLVRCGSILCARKCSGHGKCTIELVCECQVGYRVAPDCSQSEISLHGSAVNKLLIDSASLKCLSQLLCRN